MLRFDLSLLERLLQRRRAVILALASLAALCFLGSGQGVDRLLRDARDNIRSHAASGEVAIVEIDPRSLTQIARWPWPRRHHAKLVDRLAASGARLIAFDIDFSSPSDSGDDALFSEALRAEGGGVILATFRQYGGAGSSQIVENVPITPFRNNAFLAAVNVQADNDGQVRTMLSGLVTDGAPRPSLAALVAERDAAIGRSFRIDTSIRPETIPRFSFVDVIAGRVPAAELRGKRIIVGATAIEMGDRYAVPRHGVIPGVVIQAMAAETLMQGPFPREVHGLWGASLALSLIALAVRRGQAGLRAGTFGAGAFAILALPLATEHWIALSIPLAPALAALATAWAASCAFHLAGRYRQRALTDVQTGLPNRMALELMAGNAPVVVARIDRFAAIAAGLGSAATSNVVLRVADRLSFGDHAIYRIDEAHLAWIELDDDVSLASRLEGLIALMRTPIDCGRLVDVTLSFGIADPPEAGARQQVANAALAAVRAARNSTRWSRFVEGEGEETNWHLSLLGELDQALALGQVWNAYQPKLDIRSGRIVGVEALVRWSHPVRGAIAPDAFIPLVEAKGRIDALTIHVFETAMSDAKRWRMQGHEVGVAINVSAALLLDISFVARLRALIERAPIPRGAITVEVTETAAMKEPKQAIAALMAWSALGINISIDDYGTGQSSLGYLQKLPANELKIDMSFIKTLVNDSRNAIMVRSTIALAHELGLKVVAEGIEDGDCLALLAEMGCDIAQGWHIGRPMPAGDLGAFLGAATLKAA